MRDSATNTQQANTYQSENFTRLQASSQHSIVTMVKSYLSTACVLLAVVLSAVEASNCNYMKQSPAIVTCHDVGKNKWACNEAELPACSGGKVRKAWVELDACAEEDEPSCVYSVDLRFSPFCFSLPLSPVFLFACQFAAGSL